MIARVVRYFLPSPSLSSGLLLLLAALAVCALPVRGNEIPPLSKRTASWYADPANADTLVIVTRVCRDDPGRLRADPDCVNAAQGRILAAEAEAKRNLGDMTPPTNPEYWRRRPLERAEHLAHCSRMTAEQQAILLCDAARRRRT